MFRRMMRAIGLWFLNWKNDCPTCGMSWNIHRCSIDMVIQYGDRRCEVCGTGLAANTIKTWNGKWRCYRHKSVIITDNKS